MEALVENNSINYPPPFLALGFGTSTGLVSYLVQDKMYKIRRLLIHYQLGSKPSCVQSYTYSISTRKCPMHTRPEESTTNTCIIIHGRTLWAESPDAHILIFLAIAV